jgi:hypothetical protein
MDIVGTLAITSSMSNQGGEMQATAPLVAPNAWWLVVPPIWLCALDAGLTLYGQSAEYWSGNHAAVNEMSPSFNCYLAVHPLVAGVAFLLWIGIFSAMILLLPELLALMVSTAIMLGHMGGAESWLAYHFHQYQACNLVSLLTAALVVVSFKRGQNSKGRAAFDWSRTELPGWVRWVVIGGLTMLPVWWFLVPR